VIRFKDSRNYLPENVLADGDFEQAATNSTVNATDVAEGARRLAKGGGGGGSGGGGSKGGVMEGEDQSLFDFTMFEGSFLSGFLDFTERKMWKIAILGFLHTALLITGTIKTILFFKIYDGFQELILVLQTCLYKVIPFTILIYFWVIILTMMFRILGSDNGDMEVMEERYKLYGPTFFYMVNTYRSAIGDIQPIGY